MYLAKRAVKLIIYYNDLYYIVCKIQENTLINTY